MNPQNLFFGNSCYCLVYSFLLTIFNYVNKPPPLSLFELIIEPNWIECFWVSHFDCDFKLIVVQKWIYQNQTAFLISMDVDEGRKGKRVIFCFSNHNVELERQMEFIWKYHFPFPIDHIEMGNLMLKTTKSLTTAFFYNLFKGISLSPYCACLTWSSDCSLL